MGTELQTKQPAAMMPTSPMGLLQLAIEREGSIDVIERLAKLQMEMLDRDARLAYINAFEEFKRNAPTIVKDSVILVNNQERGKFAKLDQICDKLIPALLAVGITHRWKATEAEAGRIVCTCYLRHRLGHEEQGATFGAPPDISGSKNAVQAVGSTASYLERYTLVASCGIAIKDQDRVDSGNPEAEAMDADTVKNLSEMMEIAANRDDLREAYHKAMAACGVSVSDLERSDWMQKAKYKKEAMAFVELKNKMYKGFK